MTCKPPTPIWSARRETYIQLVGRAPNNLEAPPPLPGLPDTVGAALATALENNPDLIAAKERAQAAGYDTEVAGAGRLPTVGFFANVDYSDFFGSLGGPISADFAQSEKTANAGVRVTVPISKAVCQPRANVRLGQLRVPRSNRSSPLSV